MPEILIAERSLPSHRLRIETMCAIRIHFILQWKRQKAWLALLLAVAAGSVAQAADATTARLQSEAIPAWNKWMNRMGRCSGRIVKREGDGHSRAEAFGKMKSPWLGVDFYGNGPESRRVDVLNDAGAVLVGCENPLYAFHVRKKSQTDPFAMDGFWNLVGRPTASDRSEGYGQIHYFYAKPILVASVSVRTIPLERIVRSPSFVVVRADEKTNGGEKVFEMEFQWRDIEGRSSPIDWGRVVLNIDHDWCVTEYETRSPRARSVSNIEYADVDGLRYPRKVTDLVLAPDGIEANGLALKVWEITKIEFSQIPDSKFLLSAFGLPEPEVATKSRGGLSIWTVIALLTFFGAICLLVSRKLFKPT